MLGGLTSIDFLEAAPKIVHLNLNEWKTLERPGTYRISVLSHRVSDSTVNDNPFGGEALNVRSNSIELKIVAPDANWQAAQLAAIRQVLNRETPADLSGPDDLRQAALTRLRYLGTEEAARELAQRLRGEGGNGDAQCMFGLIGSAHRAAGLEEMNRLLGDPDFPVSQLFLTTMTILPLDSDNSPETLRAKREANREALTERFMNSLVHKRGKALAISLDAALSDTRARPSGDAQKRLIPELVGAFGALSLGQQAAWLQYRWDAIKDPEWLPLLRTIAQQYKDYSNDRETGAWQSLQLTGTALTRWYELDPRARASQ